MALTPATLRLDLKCGRGAISEGEKCTKGAAQRIQQSNKFLRVPKDYPGRKRPYGEGFRPKAENSLIASGQVIAGASTLVNIAELATPPSFPNTRPPYGAITASVGSTLMGVGLAAKAHRLSKSKDKTLSKTQQKQIQRIRRSAVQGITIGVLGAVAAYGMSKQAQRLNDRKLFAPTSSMNPARSTNTGDQSRWQLENLYASSASKRTRDRQNTFGELAVLKSRITQRSGRAQLERIYNRPGRRDSVYAAGFSPELDQLAI